MEGCSGLAFGLGQPLNSAVGRQSITLRHRCMLCEGTTTNDYTLYGYNPGQGKRPAQGEQAEMHSQPRLLLICGMPVTGKTAFGNWLSATHGFLHLDLEARDCLERNRLPPFWPERIWNLDAAGLATFIAYLRTTHPRTVLTWAFHTDLIPFVRQLTEQGLIPWWFEGDRLASRQKHLERGRIIKDGAAQPGMPDLVQYDHYVASLIRQWSHIAPIFGNNILHTLSPEGTYLAPETIARRIGL